MKFAVAVLALMAVAVNAQTTRDPFASFRNNYRPQTQNYQPYRQPYTTRRPYYTPVTTPPTLPPTTLPPYTVPTFVPPTSKYYNGDARSARIVKSGNEINPDGSYQWFFENDNGIAAQAQGTPRNFGGNPPLYADVVDGAFSWFAPNGEFIDFTYTADENGYHPRSNALPTSPPIPPAIARALEYLKAVNPTKK